MTTSTTIDLRAAQDALARLDEGVGQPGDERLAAALEQFLQSEQARFEDSQDRRERAEWLATQCPKHGPEGWSGEVCDDCFGKGGRREVTTADSADVWIEARERLTPVQKELFDACQALAPNYGGAPLRVLGDYAMYGEDARDVVSVKRALEIYAEADGEPL